MAGQSDPPTRGSRRRRRFTEPSDPSRLERMNEELSAVRVRREDGPGDASTDEELRRRCEVILEQVGEINGLFARSRDLPADYVEECRGRLVDVSRSTAEILESVTTGSKQPGSMSAWLLRFKRQGCSIIAAAGKPH